MAQEAPDQVNPSHVEIAAAAARQTAQAAAQAAHEARLDSLDIQDPSGLSQEAAPEPPPKQATPSAPETIPGAKVPDFSDDLLRRAYDAGFSSDQAKRFGSPENLEFTLATLARREAELYRSLPQRQAANQQEAEPPPEELPPLPDVFEDEVAGAFSARDQFLLKQEERLNKLERENQELRQHAQATHQHQLERDWSDAVASTPQEYQEDLGTSVFGATGVQQQKQQEVAALVDAMMIRNQQNGRRNPSMKEMYIQAARAVLGNKTPAATVEKARSEATGRFIAQPTQVTRNGDSIPRNLTEAQRTQGAVREIADKLRAERGF